jgi:hypothetical protein
MFPWPAAVATEPKTFRLLLDADARLAAAAGGVARYLADAAGLDNDAVARMQSAIVAACLEAFEHLTVDDPRLEITFTRLPDRMEIALSHRGEGSPAVGLDKIARRSKEKPDRVAVWLPIFRSFVFRCLTSLAQTCFSG